MDDTSEKPSLIPLLYTCAAPQTVKPVREHASNSGRKRTVVPHTLLTAHHTPFPEWGGMGMGYIGSVTGGLQD